MLVRSKVLVYFLLILPTGLPYEGHQDLAYIKDGKLSYSLYANKGEADKLNIIPDFSHAGYKGGGVAIPNVLVKLTLSALTGDNRAHIQEAIDKVSSLPIDEQGIRGAVLLKSGIYRVEGSIYIKSSGVILRGEGNTPTGTTLIATKKEQHDFIILQGRGSGYSEIKGSRRKITTSYLPTGSKTLEVNDTKEFSVGDKIVVMKTPNDKWIDDLKMRQYGWTAETYKITFERTITKINGNIITLDIPMVDCLEDKYGGGEIFKSNITGRISTCGVENIRIESDFAIYNDEAHGWNAIKLLRTENSWIRQVVAKYFGYSCVNITGMSVFNTIEDCAMIDPKSQTIGGRKYSFNIENSSAFNLFQRCCSWGGRHDYVTGSRVAGPNVFLDCDSENTKGDIGPHHRWSTGILFDNIRGGAIHVQNRKAMGTGHGWPGAQTLFWNCNSYKNDIKVESPKGARNWGIGCVGLTKKGSGYWESWGEYKKPRSLYLKQLEERLGAQAVASIATDQQLKGVIWDQLTDWTNTLVSQKRQEK